MKTVVERILEKLCAVILGGMVLLLTMQIFTRYVARGSLLWAGEMAQWLFVWMTFVAAALVFKEKGHIVIDIVYDLLPDRLKKALFVMTAVIIHAFLFLLLYYAVPVVKAYSNQTATSVEVSKSYLFVSLPVGVLLMLGFSLYTVIDRIRKK